METNTEATTKRRRSLADELGLISEEEYAEFRRVQIQALRNERNLGRGPPFTKVGKKVMYFRDAIRQEIAARTVTPQRASLLTDRRKPRRR